LNGYTEEGAEQQQACLPASEPEAATMDQRHRQHAKRGKEEAIKYHVLDAHLVQRQPAEIEACAPQAPSRAAGAVAQKRDAPALLISLFHPSFTVAHQGTEA